MGSQGGFYQSKEFLDLVKSIGEARSKAEEDRIVLSEIETLKRRISEPDTPKRKMKEYIIRLVYVEMLGHDASFGYIHAVKMTHDDTLLVKRTGYLAVTLFLNEDHDLIILIVNTIQKDLKSDNYLVVCVALNAVCKLINEETIPAVLPQIVELLAHPKEAVRKKAIMALYRFYQKSPSSVSHLVSNFRKRLCDNDPGVMGATLCPLFDLITNDVNSYKDLVISFVSILKQVAERRLPKAYDYHQMPAPFIQIKLLKILALLGSGDKQASENMYTVVGDIFRKCDSSSNIGNAVLYECICCVSSIYPNPKLLESAADAISRFLKSDSHNLKYMGIDALGRLIKISPEIAEQHQLAVIDCLEDPDDTLKRKTFELLYKMTKSTNVEVIVDRMIDYMISINDNHYKTEIASRCVELAEQFAPSNQWFIQTMNKVFEHAGDLVNIKVAHNLMRLIAEGFGEDDNTADSQLRSSAVESYLYILGEPKLPSVFLQVICWVLGEYGTADGKYSASYITGKLCDVAEAYSNDETVKAYAVTALMKIYAFEIAAGRMVDMLPEVGFQALDYKFILCKCILIAVFDVVDYLNLLCHSLMEEFLASHSTDLQQRAYELQAVIGLDAHAPEPVYPRESYQTTTVPSVSSDAASTELKLRLDGVQKKWGRQTHFPSTSTSNSTSQKTVNGITQVDGSNTANSRTRETYDSRKQVEISPEKQKLAASLFGGPSKTEKKSATGHKSSKPSSHMVKSHAPKSSMEVASEKTSPVQQPPDLLDFGEPTVKSTAPSLDPFKDLEGLLEPTTQVSSAVNHSSTAAVTKSPDIMGLYTETPAGAHHKDSDILSGLSNSPMTNMVGGTTTMQVAQSSKSPNLKDSLEKDALVRQMGVTPSSQNPNLFKDLLG
ncbi:hypothetical protein GOBAR_AA05086 [Gossypium barbadense]|uniref:AP-4 complex subunit epsilon n=1 Tax=Gossypium barbadense TaxID=3634 RepID=A0A2P5YIS8_GOSBA|nr:hypothetical protein GOBAR_AA05086 [Gossypium barbadense]